MKEFTHEDFLRNLKAYMKYGNAEEFDEWKRFAEPFVPYGDSMIKSKKYADTDEYSDYESEDKMVSHPSHYQSKNGIEVIDVIKAFTDGLEGIEAVCAGNAIKYLCRWNKKNGIQDLEKSIWYIQKLINVLKSKNKE